MNVKIPDDVEKIIAPYRERAILYFESKPHSDESKRFKEITERPEAFERMIRDFKTPDEIKIQNEAREVLLLESKIKKALDAVHAVMPLKYWNLTVAKSPRPRQFEVVKNWFDVDVRHGGGMENSLLIHGKPGTGKTAAAWALLEQMASQHYSWTFEFVKSPTFFRLAKTKHLGRQENEDFLELFQRMIDTDILVLDDFGSELVSLGSSETAFELVDARTEDDRFTLITTNSTPEALCNSFSVGERIENANKMRRRINDYFHIISFDKEL